MLRDNSRLDIITYLQNPNHYSLQDWYLSNMGGFEEIRVIDCDNRWLQYCSERGLLPFDESISSDIHDDFFENNIGKDSWLIISTKNIFHLDFQFRVVFVSALLSELELTEKQMDEIFTHLISFGAVCIRYSYFPRRIDLFPLRGPSVALILFNELSKEAKEQLQWEF